MELDTHGRVWEIGRGDSDCGSVRVPVEVVLVAGEGEVLLVGTRQRDREDTLTKRMAQSNDCVEAYRAVQLERATDWCLTGDESLGTDHLDRGHCKM